jgi:hypothetical protein
MFKKLITISLILIGLISISAQTVIAYEIPQEYTPKNTPFQDTFIPGSNTAPETVTNQILYRLSGALLYFASPLAIIMIGVSAFKITSSGADSEGIEQGKKQLTWAILGLVLIILSWALVRYVIEFVIRAGTYTEESAQVIHLIAEKDSPLAELDYPLLDHHRSV